MASDKENDELLELIKQATMKLGEHFDHIQILATNNDEAGTCCFKWGQGSLFARIGMCREMIDIDKARTYHRVKKEEFPDY